MFLWGNMALGASVCFYSFILIILFFFFPFVLTNVSFFQEAAHELKAEETEHVVLILDACGSNIFSDDEHLSANILSSTF
jgi:hypothetical protein